MRMMKNFSFVATFLILMMISFVNVDAKELNGSVSGLNLDEDTKLVGDVVLSKELFVASDKNITLDLNGHTISVPSTVSGYGINNKGTLKIIDSSSNGGSIVCENSDSSCIANSGKMEVRDVKVSSNDIALKNEPTASLTVTNSNISSTYAKSDAGVIFNYGTLLIDNSSIIGTGISTVAIMGMNADDNNVHTISKTTVKNSTVSGKTAISVPSGADDEVYVYDSSLNGGFEPRLTSKFEVHGKISTSKLSAKLLIGAVDDTVITLTKNSNFATVNSNPVDLKEGVVLKIDDNVALNFKNAKINIKGIMRLGKGASVSVSSTGSINSAVYNKNQNVYYGSVADATSEMVEGDVLKFNSADVVSSVNSSLYDVVVSDDGEYVVKYKDADYSKVNEAIAKAKKIDKNLYTSDSYNNLESAINKVITGKDITEQNLVDSYASDINEAIDNLVLVKKSTNNNIVAKDSDASNNIVNPQTYDGIEKWVILALTSLGGIILTIVYRKKIKAN